MTKTQLQNYKTDIQSIKNEIIFFNECSAFLRDVSIIAKGNGKIVKVQTNKMFVSNEMADMAKLFVGCVKKYMAQSKKIVEHLIKCYDKGLYLVREPDGHCYFAKFGLDGRIWDKEKTMKFWNLRDDRLKCRVPRYEFHEVRKFMDRNGYCICNSNLWGEL